MITDYLKTHEKVVRRFLGTTDAQWVSFLKRLSLQEAKKKKDYYDEQVWTFMIASGFAFGREHGIQKLGAILTGCQDLDIDPGDKIWLEALPLPPREKEGNTNLDMALGRIRRREVQGKGRDEETGNGIEYAGGSGFVCFCEMKWYSDISKSVTHDQHRNQLARVIENALTFQAPGEGPDKIYVVLVTPKVFRERKPQSRLYAYKFDEYIKDSGAILADLDGCSLPRRSNARAVDLAEKLERLHLRWVAYEELLDEMVGDHPNQLDTLIRNFYNDYCGCTE